MGTPAYMAPEQARGGAKSVTTAADVYGLGAMLYAALTGQAPVLGRLGRGDPAAGPDEAPARPRSLDAKIDRDLETICLKCLEKDPARRYGSAEDLAEDLDRWLDGRPIEARPSSVREQAIKWVRRHRSLAALLAVVAASVLSLVIGGLWFNVQLQAALETAGDRLYVAEVIGARRAKDDNLIVLADRILERQCARAFVGARPPRFRARLPAPVRPSPGIEGPYMEHPIARIPPVRGAADLAGRR